MIIYLGLFLILDSIWGYVLGFPYFVGAYTSIVLAEEDFLSRSFGASWEDYRRRVRRFLPSLGGFGRTLTGMEFQWKRLVRKEYGATFAWISTALVLLVWGDILRRGFPAARPTLEVALGIWAPVLATYALARYLKKSGRLGSD
jgi:hypothetical protein